jgi:peptidyl-prolyl cis-trans isomerase B (cyclophilin B)
MINRTGLDPQFSPPHAGDKVAIMETDFGTIKIRLFTRDVPTLTRNFSGLAQSGNYNNTPFHRVVKDFMIQGGDFTNKDGTGGYSYKGPDTYLPNEINPAYHHLYGTLSMAKTSQPVSIGSQFFIVTNKKGADFLDGKYSPIGQVYEGMDVAEKIQNLQIPGTEQPSQTVNVKKVTITTYTDENTGNTQN